MKQIPFYPHAFWCFFGGILFACAVTGCEAFNNKEKMTPVFNYWHEETFSPVKFKRLISPNRQFTLEYATEDLDISDKHMLSLIHNASGQKVIIGQSTRGINANWKKTQIGDIVLVENLVDTHFVESFVLYPQLSENGNLFFTTLYSTPNLNYYDRSQGRIPPEHIYTSIKNVTFDGIMTISIMWNYADSEREGNNMVIQMPIFYGAKENTDSK